MVVHVIICTYMHRYNAELIVNKLLVAFPPPQLIFGQKDYSRLESSWTKEVLLLENQEAFLKDLPHILFRGHHS
jgi:hypothetical protein